MSTAYRPTAVSDLFECIPLSEDEIIIIMKCISVDGDGRRREGGRMFAGYRLQLVGSDRWVE